MTGRRPFGRSHRFHLRGSLVDRLSMHASSRRELYRIVYPLAERPSLELGRFVYEVIDCCELGLRYRVPDLRVPAVGTRISGTLRFRRGAEILIDGKVLRTAAGQVVIALDKPGTTFFQILAEQRYLRQKGYTLTD
jgi:hypothetical protein